MTHNPSRSTVEPESGGYLGDVGLKDIRDQRRPRPQDIDRHIGARMRERRVMLGLAQQQLAELIGDLSAAHKYEKGINRISGGRLYMLTQALGVEVGYFYA